jgi:hypothetical protein
MEWMVFALASRGVVPAPADLATALFSLATSLAFTAAVGWFASRVTRERIRRQVAELAEATPVGGVH